MAKLDSGFLDSSNSSSSLSLHLQHVASNGCMFALFSARNVGGLDGVMGLMLGGLRVKEAARSTVVFFEKIARSGAAKGHAGFWHFVFDQVLVTLWRLMLDKVTFSVKDAMCSKVAGEAASFMWLLRSIDGPRYERFVDGLTGFVGRDMGPLKGGEGGEAQLKKDVKQALREVT